MTTTTKRNTDYSVSAVNLVNPPEMVKYLKELHDAQASVARLDAVLRAFPEYEELKRAERSVLEVTDSIRGMVDVLGSYQDIEKGEYALKQRRLTKQYNAALFEQFFPEYAPAVLKKTVDTVKLNGLVKGGLLSEDGMRRAGILFETEGFAYIIR